MKRIAPRSWPLPLKAAALVALVAAPALAAPYIPSTPDLGKAEGRCRAGKDLRLRLQLGVGLQTDHHFPTSFPVHCGPSGIRRCQSVASW